MEFVFVSVSEHGYNGVVDEGVDGAMPQTFWARTAPDIVTVPIIVPACTSLMGNCTDGYQPPTTL